MRIVRYGTEICHKGESSLEPKAVCARMFGEFQISCAGIKINSGRSYRAWPMLAYLVFHHDRMIARDELIRIFADGDRLSDPANFMRLTIHRIRRVLDPIGAVLGKELIVTRNGAYGWNPEVPLALDTEEFEAALRSGEGAEDPQEKLYSYRQAFELYTDDFLSQLSGESWVAPAAAYYRELYFNAVLSAGEMLIGGGLGRDAAGICRSALRFDPLHEPLSRQLMLALVAARDYAGAVETYKALSKRLYDELGVSPETETREVYQKVMSRMGGSIVSPEELAERLREESPGMGAMVCDYEDFRRFYQAEARSAARRGDAVHIAIVTVTSKSGFPMSELVLRNTMTQLEQHIRKSLRLGDVAAACSASQFVLMLVQANFENSEKVLERIAAGFYRDHPHTAAYLQYAVLPIEPLDEQAVRAQAAEAGKI